MSVAPASTSHDVASSKISVFSIVVLSLSFIWCAYWVIHSWNYWEDDSYIHLEFAKNLAAGHGFSFNGRPVYGDTSPLWVFLLVGTKFFIPNLIVAGKVLAVLGAVFGLSGAYAFSRTLTRSHPNREKFAAAMVLLMAVNPYFCYWSFSGMETVAAAGLAFWGTVAASSLRPTFGRFLAGCLLAGLAPLLRPEMVFFTAILSLLLLTQWNEIPVPNTSFKKLCGFAAGLILAAGPTLIWAIYAVHTFGRIIPNTNAAKRAAPHASVPIRLLNVYSLGYPVILAGLLAALIYAILHFSAVKEGFKSLTLFKKLPAGGWVFVVWSLLAAVFYVVNHTHVQTRYILVTASGLAIVVLAVIQSLSPLAYRAFLGAGLILAMAVSSTSVWLFIRNKAIFNDEVKDLALFVRSQLPTNAPVADYSIGEIAYFSEHPIIDTGGITQPDAIAYLQNPDAMLQWIHSVGGVYYLTTDQPEPGAVVVYTKAIPYIGWSLNYRSYSQPDQMSLWKLPTPTSAVPASAH